MSMTWDLTKQVIWCCLLGAVITEAFKLTHSEENEYLTLHHRMTKREIKQYFGVDTYEEVPEYDVTSPFQADASGEFISYKLHEHARHKRDADEPNVWYYKMETFGMPLHLNLTKSNNLFGPDLVVEKIHENGSKGYKEIPHTAFYDGHVTSDPDSIVAISNHDGLKGMVNFMDSSLFMQPLPDHLAKHHGSSGGSRPHLIYRRSLNTAKGDCELSEGRSKRSVSMEKVPSQSFSREARSITEKHLEVMMVGDHLFLQKFVSEEEATEVLLLMAHMVNALYHDNSIGAIKLTISVVRIVHHRSFSYTSSDSNLARLGALGAWVNSDMPMSDVDPQHADQVILVTGKGSGGIARSSSTCASGYGPSVSNGDMGLATVLQIAHESAHALAGVGHDGNSPECPDGTFIMSTATPGGQNAHKWSPCSSSQLQTFLSGSSSSCLDDTPTNLQHVSSDYHHKLPGQVYDGDAQCLLQYGSGYRFCTQMQSSCGSLYCTQGGSSCVSYIAPPADGTKCGERKWCIKGKCVDDGSPMIDGGWSEWSDYTACSYSCGGGVQYKSRTCTNPLPQNGGMICEGVSIGHWKICNSQACSEESLTHREEQCETVIAGSLPYIMGNPCGLYCKVGSTIYLKGTAADGTRCSLDKKIKDVCIKATCRSVGCDDVLESGVKEDRCKVCNGDATSCILVNGTVTNPCEGTCTVLDVPIGAIDVEVKEEVEDWNFLGVKNAEDAKVYNVGYIWSTSVAAAGTTVYYTHEKNEDADKVDIPGPTNAHLYVYYWQFVARQPVDYFYKMPVGDGDPPVITAMWDINEWSDCSHTCAGGIQTRKVECVVTEDMSYLNDVVCQAQSSKPATEQPCNTQSCAPFWYVSGWRPCSKTCGKGVQTRQILCRQEVSRGQFNTLPDSQCSAAKPNDPETQDCNEVDCPAENVPGEWSECSTSCREGVKTRSTSCQRLKETGVFESVPEVMCYSAITPALQEACNQDVPCPGDRQYVPLGCYNDNTSNRTLPILIDNLRGRIIWSDMSLTIDECANLTSAYNHSLQVFSLQFYGECYSGYNGLQTYNALGALPYSDSITNHCWDGVGGPGVNFVYKFKEY